MRRACVAMVAILVLRCSSVSTPAHPSLDHRIVGCYVSCPFGYASRSQHLCRSDRRNGLDILITGEDDNPLDPSESRWLTGYINAAAEGLIVKRLAAHGITQTSKEWSQRFGQELQELQSEYGDSVRATYLKIDVVLQTCASYFAMQCLAKTDNPCASHPGEPDPTHPFGGHRQ